MIQKMIQRLRHNALFIGLIVVAIAIVVAMIVMYMGSSSVKAEQSSLRAEQTRAQINLNLAKDQYDLDMLRGQWAALQGSPSFPSEVSIVQLSSFLETGSERYGVRIVKAGQASTGNYNITIEGSPAKMNGFLIYLENGPFDTLRLQSLNFTQIDGTLTISIATR
jgi:hypothetical protein